MQLNEIKDNEGARKGRMRVGRGIGCSKGKTCGRGYKGQKSRTGVRINGFEGGQMPLHRRLPKRGFNNHSRTENETINLGDLQRYVDAGTIDASKPVTRESLAAAGIIRNNDNALKLLAKGTLKAKLTIEVDAASAAAEEAVKKAGGSLKRIEKALGAVAAKKAAKAKPSKKAKADKAK